MKPLTKNLICGAVVAAGMTLAGVGAASAGEWRLNGSLCPELRYDRHGRVERTIACPARAWVYERGPGERRGFYSAPRPHEVIVRDGRHFYRGAHGRVELRVN